MPMSDGSPDFTPLEILRLIVKDGVIYKSTRGPN
jgi:hypothetical protein